jgi:hypothetical protein
LLAAYEAGDRLYKKAQTGDLQTPNGLKHQGAYIASRGDILREAIRGSRKEVRDPETNELLHTTNALNRAAENTYKAREAVKLAQRGAAEEVVIRIPVIHSGPEDGGIMMTIGGREADEETMAFLREQAAKERESKAKSTAEYSPAP